MKLTQLQQIQTGKESTRGTAVTQTKQLMGLESLDISDWVTILSSRELGTLAPSTGTPIVGSIGGEASFDGRVNYNQLPLFFDSLFGTASPSGVGPYVYAYTAPDTSVSTRTMLTLAKGDASDAQSLTGAVLSELELVFEPDAFITMSGTFVGHHVEDDSIDSVSAPTVIYPNNGSNTISMGTLGGSLSALTCDVRQATLAINTNTTNHRGVGNLAPCGFAYGEVESTLSIVANGDYATLRALQESLYGTSPTVSVREFQIQVTDGTNIIDIDWVGYLDGAPSIYGDEDGVAVLEMEFIAAINSTSNLTSWCDVSITNGESVMF